jgi:hypothetical protein
MRNPRIDRRKGDVLEHPNGERRAVLTRGANGLVQYKTSRWKSCLSMRHGAVRIFVFEAFG